MEIELKNKYILVTGGTSGIGFNLIKKLLELGAYVATNYHLDDKRAETMCNELQTYGEKFQLFKADVRNEGDMSCVIDQILLLWPNIDILINNAGIIADSAIVNMELVNWNKVIDTNLNGAFICTKVVANEMIKKENGKIINIASLQGIWGSMEQANYSASKAGLIAMTKSVAKELGKYNISVNAVCPGHIATNLNRNDNKKMEVAIQRSVLKRNSALKDLIMFVVMLCSDEIQGISGQVFRTDSRVE